MTDTVQRLMVLVEEYGLHRAADGYMHVTHSQSTAIARAALESALREQDAEIERLRGEVAGVRRYCADTQECGTVNERIVARTVARMLARQPD